MSQERRDDSSAVSGSTTSSTVSNRGGGADGRAASGANSSGSGQVVPVRIAGHEYKIRSSGDPSQLQQIASYVDRAMTRVRDRTGTVDTLDVAVLTCLNLAREILALRERGEGQHSGASVDALQLRSLIERVEAVVALEAGPSDQSGAARDQSEEALPRTIELPSVESLHDRSAFVASSGASSSASSSSSSGVVSDASSEAGQDEESGMTESRVASGGRRDRAS